MGRDPRRGPSSISFFFKMRGEDQQSGYEWAKLSLASTGKLVVRTGIKKVAGQTCALLDYGEESCRMGSAESSVSCAAIVVSRIDPGSSSGL